MNVTGAGIFNRGLDDNPSAMWDDVASVCRHLKYSSNYADWQDVDEDIATIPFYGGGWNGDTGDGITCRDLYNDPADIPTDTWGLVASKKIIYLLPHRKEAYGYIFNI